VTSLNEAVSALASRLARQITLQRKLNALDSVSAAARCPAWLTNLSYSRMQSGDRERGDAYLTEDLPQLGREEDADKLCYTSLEVARETLELTPRLRRALRLWARGLEAIERERERQERRRP
jgi:hypothetical protein